MNVRYMSVALVAVLLGGTVQAKESRVYSLVYSAPVECPDRAAFSSAVQSNSARIRHALAEETAVAVKATVTATNDEFEGKLEIRHPDGTETSRSVPGASCPETVEAMALIVTLTLDPDAEEPALFEEIEPRGPAVTESLPPTPYDSPYPASALDPVAPSTLGVDAPPSTGSRTARKGEQSWRLRFGASLGVTSANGPELSPEYGVELGVTLGSSPLSPLILLSGHLADSGNVVRDGETARFTRAIGRLSGCPAVAHSGVVVLLPCFFFGLGQLRMGGWDAPSEAGAQMPWIEFGARLRGEAKLGPLIVGAEFGAAALAMRGGLSTPAYFYEVPPFAVSGAIDLGLQI